MSHANTTVEIDYPESDGKPMGETDLHRDWMMRLIQTLQTHYRGQPVYVSGDLLVYYQKGNHRKFVVPDCFVVKDCQPGRRRIFKLWEEERSPDVVFEVTSRSTKREDEKTKPEIFARIGVKEYCLYDPTADYLDPPLRGFRWNGHAYVPIEPDADGALVSEELNLALRLDENDELRFVDRRTGERLLSPEELLEAERRGRLEAEAENARLRKLLDERNGGG